jgi:hypothetical protein
MVSRPSPFGKQENHFLEDTRKDSLFEKN